MLRPLPILLPLLLACVTPPEPKPIEKPGPTTVEAPVAFAPPPTCRKSPSFIRQLNEFVSANRLEFQRCFDEVFPRVPQPRGALELGFTAQPDGRVTNVSVANDTVPDPKVGVCIVAKVQRWTLPTCPDAALGAVFPLAFGPK